MVDDQILFYTLRDGESRLLSDQPFIRAVWSMFSFNFALSQVEWKVCCDKSQKLCLRYQTYRQLAL